jgi:pimeloyl-ACP methyl ester carboxylesterase
LDRLSLSAIRRNDATRYTRMESSERIVPANGVELCVETFGDRADPAILLIMGAAASMVSWEDEFCERLAGGSRFVIRYDHRDTGRSVTYEPGAPPYTLRDLATDALGVLDAFDLTGAHLVGMSMGGAIAQIVALDHPDRVASLILISTSPAAPGPRDPDLPGMSEEARARFNELAEPDWSNRSAAIDYVVGIERACAGRSPYIDEAAMRVLATRIVDRTLNIESSMKNHVVMDSGGDRWRDRLSTVRAPTLVIHGTEDPVLPYGNALALVKEILGARLLTLEGAGHELPRPVWDVALPAILQHTAGG